MSQTTAQAKMKRTKPFDADPPPLALQSKPDEADAAPKERTLSSLLVETESFFRGHSIEELARVQGVEPIRDVSVLAGGWPDDEDVEAFLAEIYRLRG